MNFINFINNLASKISETTVVKSLRQGLIYTLPLILIGSFCTLVLYFPVPFFQNGMNSVFGRGWKNLFLFLHEGTFNIISILVCISITYSLLNNSKFLKEDNINLISPLLVVFGCYITAVTTVNDVISIDKANSSGLFVSMFLSITITKLFLWLYKHKIISINFMLEDSDMLLSQNIKLLEPAFILFLIVSLFKIALSNFLEIDIYTLINYKHIETFPFLQNKLGFAYLFTILNQCLWFLGIHGYNILHSIRMDTLLAPTYLNRYLFDSGLAPKDIFTKEFFDVFVHLGGSGGTICLVLAIFLRGKNNNTYKLAKFSFIPSIFNVNEIIVYGMPIVLSPFFLVPFLLTPLVLITSTYLFMVTGLVPLTILDVVWSCPIFINGYIATGYSYKGVLLQLFNLIIGTLIYIPFVKINEQHILENNKKVFSKLVREINYVEEVQNSNILNRHDDVGHLSRSLSKDISNALYENINPFFLEYQPQVNNNQKVIGCEALLRWNHENYGMIPPPVIIVISERANLIDDLGYWIIETAFIQLSKWNEEGLNDIVMSVNLSAIQLRSKTLIGKIKKIIKTYNLNPKHMEFELTENVAINQSNEIKIFLKELKSLGVRIAMDDFGMGHSSLLYIKDFFIDTVKIDGVLVKDIATDTNSQEIVTTITKLCNILDLNIIAEVVETNEQKNKLIEVGCNTFQGYFYSRSLPPDAFKQYVNKRDNKE